MALSQWLVKDEEIRVWVGVGRYGTYVTDSLWHIAINCKIWVETLPFHRRNGHPMCVHELASKP